MAVLGSFVQQPREALYYTIDYSCWLDDSIPEALTPGLPTLIVSPVTVPALVVSGTVVDPDKVTLLVSGGLDRTSYKIEIIVGTDNNQIKESEVKIKVRDR